MQEFIIKETGEKEELSIIDPKSGCCWVSDLMGNHGAFNDLDTDEDTDLYVMPQEDFEWWKDLIKRYQRADNIYHELRNGNRLDDETVEELETCIQDIGSGCDLEYYPEFLINICADFENEA